MVLWIELEFTSVRRNKEFKRGQGDRPGPINCDAAGNEVRHRK